MCWWRLSGCDWFLFGWKHDWTDLSGTSLFFWFCFIIIVAVGVIAAPIATTFLRRRRRRHRRRRHCRIRRGLPRRRFRKLFNFVLGKQVSHRHRRRRSSLSTTCEQLLFHAIRKITDSPSKTFSRQILIEPLIWMFRCGFAPEGSHSSLLL